MSIIKLKKCILSGVTGVVLFCTLSGCVPDNKDEGVSSYKNSDYTEAENLYETIIAALETEDTKGIKELFSPYALENANELDEKIQELIEFFPGCNGGYEVVVPTYRSTDYGVVEYILYPKYTITNEDTIYQMRLTMYMENDSDKDKEGLYMIQIMTDDAWPDGFKWKDEADTPGIYVLE